MAASITRSCSSEPYSASTSKFEEKMFESSMPQTMSTTNGIAGLVARQASASPNALAISDGRIAMTYGALDARANRLAHHLISLGVGPETIVGICLNRSAQSI